MERERRVKKEEEIEKEVNGEMEESERGWRH